MVEAASRVKK